jgi:prepilin-type N-terminal cleavage/methylation domain-containing protein
MSRKQIAFTLIELLVVIAIIGILSGLIVVSMGGMTDKASIAKSQIFSNSLRNSLMSNLVSEWKFDGSGLNDGDNATTAYTQDTWGGGNNCAISGTPKVKAGSNCINNSCIQFNGSTSDYLSCTTGSNLSLSDSISLEFWTKITAAPTEDYAFIVGKAYDYFVMLGTASATALYFCIYDTSNTKICAGTCPNLGYNSWHHVVATFDKALSSQRLKLFIDGGLSRFSDGNGMAIRKASNTLYMGYTNGYFNGLIDGVRIYNAALPTSQIKEQYYAGLNNLLISNQITNEEYLSKINDIARQ